MCTISILQRHQIQLFTAENFAVVRHIVLNILKTMDDKMSVARRRRHCAYDDAYLEKVISKIHA